MIIVDASVIAHALVDAHPTIRARLSSETLAAPDILDVEVASAVRGLWLGGTLDDQQLTRATSDLARMRVERHPSAPLIPRALEMRANLTAYDATYVALAEILGCTLVTLDRRMAAASGVRCAIEVPST